MRAAAPGWRAGWGSLGMGVQGDPGSSACPQECCTRRGAHPRLPGSQVGKHPCPRGSLPLACSLPSWGPGQTAGQPKAPGPRGPLHTLHPLLAPCRPPVPCSQFSAQPLEEWREAGGGQLAWVAQPEVQMPGSFSAALKHTSGLVEGRRRARSVWSPPSAHLGIF